MADETDLQRTVRAVVKRHGSLRKAQAAIGVNFVYLHNLALGNQSNPSDDVLKKLGLKRGTVVRTFRKVK